MLTRRQAALIPFLLTMKVEHAVLAAKVSKAAAYEWLKQAGFRAALKEAQDAAFSDAVGQLKANVAKATEKLVSLVDCEDPQLCLKAANSIIDHATKLVAVEEFERRIADLERRQAAMANP